VLALFFLLAVACGLAGIVPGSYGSGLSRRIIADYGQGYRANHGHVHMHMSERRRVGRMSRTTR
jgi:hypothetical protein